MDDSIRRTAERTGPEDGADSIAIHRIQSKQTLPNVAILAAL
jgi:hypothetical protein